MRGAAEEMNDYTDSHLGALGREPPVEVLEDACQGENEVRTEACCRVPDQH